jgi:hypothetical protein
LNELFTERGSAQKIEIVVSQNRNPENNYVLIFNELILRDNEIKFIRVKPNGDRDTMRYYWNRRVESDFMKRIEITNLSRKKSLVSMTLVLQVFDAER